MAAMGKRLKALAGFAAFAAVGSAITGVAVKVTAFQKSISDLGAITGAPGADLERLSDASKRIGATTTLIGSPAAEAFKFMASSKPDLLDNLDALEATTLASVTLAEAAGLELPEAPKALGESLNQFGKGAEDAAKLLDLHAQGARLGSSEISETSEALKNSGVVARLAGLSFAETNAAIRGMASAGVKGSDAGTKLRSVLVKLQTQSNDDFNPAIVGINDALENLADAHLTTSQQVEIFGEKQVVSAQILIDQRKNIKDLSGELKNSLGAATDQAATRTDNLWGDMKRLGSVFEAVQLNLGEKMMPTLRLIITSFTDILTVVAKMTASDSVEEANSQFSIFDATLKTLFVTGSIIKNLFDIVADTFVGFGRIIGAVFSGSLDNVMEEVDKMGAALNSEVDDIAETAFRTFNAAGAAEMDKAAASFKAPMEEILSEIVVTSVRKTTSAGQEAAAEASRVAQEARDKLQLDREVELERIRQGFRTEREIIAENWALKLEQLVILQEELVFTEEEANQKRIEMAMATANAIAKLERKSLTQRQKFEEMTSKNKTKFVLGQMVSLTSGAAQHSKTLFKLNKAAGIANAVINTYEGVSAALALGPPASFILAPLPLVAGLAQVSSSAFPSL